MKKNTLIALFFVAAFSSINAQETPTENLPTSPVENGATSQTTFPIKKHQFSIGNQFSTGLTRGLELGYHLNNRHHFTIAASPFRIIGAGNFLGGFQYQYDFLRTGRWSLGAYAGHSFFYAPRALSSNPAFYQSIGASFNYGLKSSFQLNKHWFINGSFGQEASFGTYYNSSGVKSSFINFLPTNSFGIQFRF